MDPNLICFWLGLPPNSWPPDHYRLLGLDPSQVDPAVIEQHVQERLDVVRRYQLSHPEAATEAMNRLAQALICLTDAEARKAYDAQLPGAAPLPKPAAAPAPAEETKDPLTWLLDEEKAPATAEPETASSAIPPAKPAVPQETAYPAPEQAVPEVSRPNGAATPAPLPLAPVALPVPAPVDNAEAILEAAQQAPAAQQGLDSRRSCYRRLAQTRQMVRAWEQLGKLLGQPGWRVSRPAEATELIRRLTNVRTLLDTFPPLLGHAGQPGYLVVALARQQVIVPTFQSLLPGQREALARDWRQGQKLLTAHRDWVRQEVQQLPRPISWRRRVRAVRTYFRDRPGAILLLLALLALALAFWKTFVQRDWQNHAH